MFDHITRPVRDDDAVAFSRMNPDTLYSDLDPELKRYRDDIFDDKYKRLDPYDISRTITAHIAKDGYWYIHPYQDRTLTVREAARLQTFPDWVRFAGPPSAAFRQIGNAVPVVLGRRIGEAVLRVHKLRDRKSRLSTKMIAGQLSSWFKENPPVKVPWLAAELAVGRHPGRPFMVQALRGEHPARAGPPSGAWIRLKRPLMPSIC